jgi:methyl-accepting chemotaxis protein
VKKFQLSSIRTRLLAVVSLAVVLAVAIGGVAHLSLAKVADSGTKIAERANPAIGMAQTRTSWIQFVNTVDVVGTIKTSDGMDAAWRTATNASNAVLAGLDTYLASNPNPEQAALIQETARPMALQAIQAWNDELKPLTKGTYQGEAGDFDYEYAQAKRNAYNGPAYAVDMALDEIALKDKHSIDETVAAANRTSHNAVIQMWSMAIVGALVMLFFGLALAASITRPLRRTVQVLEEVAGGDLTQRLEISTDDELGQMASALNTTLSTVHDVVSQLESDADRLLTYANRVSDDSSSASEAVAKVSEELGKVQRSSDELGTSVRDLSQVEADEVAPSLDRIAAQVSALQDTLAGTELSEAVSSGAELTSWNKATAADLAEMAGNLNAMISLFVLRHDEEPSDDTAHDAAVEENEAADA